MQSTLWFEYLAGVLISTQSAADLRRHNPYLSDAQCSALLTQTAKILSSAVHVGALPIQLLCNSAAGCVIQLPGADMVIGTCTLQLGQLISQETVAREALRD